MNFTGESALKLKYNLVMDHKIYYILSILFKILHEVQYKAAEKQCS